MERDERKIQDRDPKRKLMSEEKWSEGTNWSDLVKEGAERERVFITKREKEEKEREIMADRALQIMVPGTEAIKPVIPSHSLPTGFLKKTFGPKLGGPIFNELLSTSTQIHDLVNASGRNIASMISSMTIQVGKEGCDVEKLMKMGIEVQEDGENYLLETAGIVDTGTDISCSSDEFREALGRSPLRDASGRIIGIGGSKFNMEKDKLRLVDCDKEITVLETRKIGQLGINSNNNPRFNEVVRLELGTSREDSRFEWNLQESKPHILLGLKSGSLLSSPMKEDEMLRNNLEIPVFSPEIQV